MYVDQSIKQGKVEYLIDENGDELLLKDDKYQLMMEWEKPYMKACIEELQPRGDVLEVGFGCGYSAKQIQKYNPKSHTIIECHPDVIRHGTALGFSEMSEKYLNVRWVQGAWQEVLAGLGKFDEIFFDTYAPIGPDVIEGEIIRITQEGGWPVFPLEVEREFEIFIDQVLESHTNSGAKISAYMNSSTPSINKFSTNNCNDYITQHPKIIYTEKIIEVDVPENCDYFKGSKAVIPIIEKRG